MRLNPKFTRTGWQVSAFLAVTYTVLTLACLLLVGLLTSGSWQANFLGISWKVILGFEIGLLAAVFAGLVITAVFKTIFNLIVHGPARRAKTSMQEVYSSKTYARLWAIRLVGLCFILPALFLIILRSIGPLMTSSGRVQAASDTSTSPGSQIHLVNLGPGINTAMREAEPSFSPDGHTMYFNCNNSDICITHLLGSWEEGKWTSPQVVGAPISSEYEDIEPLINAAGDKLYFNSNRPIGLLKNLPFLSPLMDVFETVNMIASKWGVTLFDGLGVGHVYVSYKVDGVWSEPRLLNEVPGEPPVNSAFHDHCLSFSGDGNQAFWSSTRPGGYGGNDIWTSRRVNGQWTAPEDLGPNVNSAVDEHHPILTPDGKSLYVTSNRPGGYGGEDIYVSTRDANGKWGPVVNLGPQLNGPGDDRCPVWTPNLKILLFDSVKSDGYGARDLWWVYFKDIKGYPLAMAGNGVK